HAFEPQTGERERWFGVKAELIGEPSQTDRLPQPGQVNVVGGVWLQLGLKQEVAGIDLGEGEGRGGVDADALPHRWFVHVLVEGEVDGGGAGHLLIAIRNGSAD